MKRDNIQSPRRDATPDDAWSDRAMKEARPYPMPEVPPDDAPAKPARTTGGRGPGRTIEGGRPEGL